VLQDKNQDNTKLQDKSQEEMIGEEVLILAAVSDLEVALAEAQVLEEVSDQEVLDKK
jgi:hypothetical protein